MLKSCTCGSLVADKSFTATATSNDTIEKVLSKLQTHDILSVPIYNEAGQIYAIVSVLDILTYISWGKYFRSEDVSDEEVTKFRHMSHTVGTLLDQMITSIDKVWVYPPETSIHELLEPFSKGIHRVLIPQQDSEGNSVYRVLSQTDIIKFLYKHADQYKELMSKTVAELTLGSDKVKSVPSDTRALDALKNMSLEKVAAVAIVDKENGKLVGNLSASDLRALNAQKLPSILEYVGKFLIVAHGYVRMPVTVTGLTPLREVMRLIIEEHVHRVWIVDDSRRPVGVISMLEIIIFVFNNME